MTAADIAPLTQPSAFVAIDMAVPTQQPNPFWFGATQMFVSCPAQNVYNQYLGQIELTGRRLGGFQTYRFAVPTFVQQQLAGHDCANFSLTFVINVPSSGTGVYRVDNLRFKTANDPTSTGTGASLDLVALRTVSPPGSTPGTASFAERRVQVPDSFHVAQGRSGTGQLTLLLAAAAGDRTTCTYTGADQGTSYRFASCSRGEQPGDLVIAGAATMTIVAGDATAGDTKVKAQLAVDPTGDELVSGLTPIPTFWGDSAADTATISSAYFTRVSDNPQGGAQVTLPTPEIGKRAANPVRIRNRLDPNAPPLTPHDPPFDQYGDVGGSDLANAYWTLTGHLDGSAGASSNFTTSIDAKAAVHGQLLGIDQEILSGHIVYNSDSGTVTATGRTGGSATGSAEVDLFGASVASVSLDQSVTKRTLYSNTVGFSLPVITFGIFSVDLGLSATVGVDLDSTTRVDGLLFTLTPSAVATASVSANVNAVIASGGISANIQLIDLQLPITASAVWGVNTSPDVCKAVLDFNADANATVSVGAGSINAHVTFGDCDFFGLCDTENWTITSWGPLASTTIPFLNIHQDAAVTVPFLGSVCNLPFNMAIDCGGDGQTVVPGLPIAFAGPAQDPPHDTPCTQEPCLALPTLIPCEQRSWSTGDPDDQIEVLPDDNAAFSIDGVDSCPVAITFAKPGPHTVTMTADNGHSTSHVSKVVSVVAPTGTTPFVSMLLPPQGCRIGFGPSQHVPLRAAALDPTGATPISFAWDQGPGTASIGTGASTQWTDTPFDTSTTIRVTATSPGGSSAATTLVDFADVTK
ncbi:MAG TPA: hypothetical protein VHW23_31745 [Kofleriaceae bacterium]|nr:hypothetical protein [Kofleriaceae bacterium]